MDKLVCTKNTNMSTYFPCLGNNSMLLSTPLSTTSPFFSSACSSIDHLVINSLLLSYCLSHPHPSYYPQLLFSLEKSSMNVQVDHEHNMLSSTSFICPPISVYPPILLSLFVPVFYAVPVPSLFPIFLSMDGFLFMPGCSRLTDIVSWPRQAKPLSVPDI